MADRRYDEQQIGEILQRAGEIQAGLSPESEAQGVTLHDLQKVAAEVGIEPHIVERAAKELDTRPATNLLDSPHSRMLDQTIDGLISDEQWDDAVMALRQFAGVPGITTTQGSTREWSASWGTSNIMLTALVRNGRTRLRLLTDTSGGAAVIWTLSATVGFFITVATSAILGKSGLGAWLVAMVAAAMVSTIILLTTYSVRQWRTKAHKNLANLFNSLISTMSAESASTGQSEVPKVEELPTQRVSAD